MPVLSPCLRLPSIRGLALIALFLVAAAGCQPSRPPGRSDDGARRAAPSVAEEKPAVQPPSQPDADQPPAKPVDLSALMADVVDKVLAESPAETEVRWAAEPITVDGRADEPAWRRAQVIDDFRLPWLGEGGRAPYTATKARLLWDRDYLYFFAEMEDSDLYADEIEQDGMLWNNDVFELFFKPHDERPGYYEFQVNAAGAQLDMFLPRRGAGGYGRFKSSDEFEWETAVVLRGTLNDWTDEDEGWSVEGRIPWSDFRHTGGRPATGDVWKFALCRYDYSVAFEGPDLSTSAPLKQLNFHRHEDYAPMRFVGPRASARKAPFGIERRTPWTSSRVVGSPEPPLPYRVQQTFTKLNIRQPLFVYPEPGTDRLLVIQHLGNWAGPGKILRIADDDETDQLETLLSLDYIAYGLAFHPDYEQNGYVYVGMNGPVAAKNKMTRVSRFTVDRQPPYKCDPASELVIIEWPSDGHNGGDLGFSPKDGMLYITAGDGTSDSDTNLTGQDLTNLCGTVLRINVDQPDEDKPYSVPPDNPFLKLPGACPEIWAYGLRNPWRMTFDEKSGDLWVGNNGQDLWEQVYLIRRGENYGWSIYEGSHPFYLERQRGPTPIVGPILEHPHSEARSLTGGVVYYGTKLPELYGAYIYGDWSTGKIWGAKYDGQKITWHQELADTTLQIGGFGSDHAGELFVVDQGGGIYRLEPTPEEVAQAEFPRKLSETGLFLDTAAHETDPGLIPYSVNAPVWADGADQQRWLGLPGNERIDFPAWRGWNLPNGTVVIKTLLLQMEAGRPESRKRIETQMLTRQQNEWQAYTYIWNDEETDAELAPAAGAERVLVIRDPASPQGTREQLWRYASRSECMACHSRAANYVLGLTELQMNKLHDYGGALDNQYRTLEHLGVFRVNWLEHEQELYNRLVGAIRQPLVQACERLWLREKPRSEPAAKTKRFAMTFPDDLTALLPAHIEYGRRTLLELRKQQRSRLAAERRFTTRLPRDPGRLTRLVDPYEPSADLEARARSYLHANCSQCHVEAGGGNAQIVLEWNTDRKRAHLFDLPPMHAAFNIQDAKLVAPGDPYRSVLYYRMATLGGGRMPRVGSGEVDRAALRLIHDWIEQLPGTAGRTASRPVANESTPLPGQSDERRQEIAALNRLRTGGKLPAEERSGAIERLLATTSGSLMLVHAVEMKQVPENVREEAVQKGAAHLEPQTRDLFERYVPLAQRAKRIGAAVDAEQLLAVPGDAERGRHLWFNVATVQCKSCHRIGSEGPELVGPDLTEVGKKYTKAQLLEEILEPSKKIDPKYMTYLVQTSEGRVVGGVMVSQSETEVVLKNEKNELIRIPADEVEQLAPSQKSLMPELLLKDLTAEQAADLLEFLHSLGRQP